MTVLKMTEAQLQAAMLDIARLHRCLVHHCRPARQADGSWRTPIQGDAGFPDLVIVGEGGLLVRELKSEGGQASPMQASWMRLLTGARVDVATWRPSDLRSGRILAEIMGISR